MDLPPAETVYMPFRELARDRLRRSLAYAKSHFRHGNNTVLVLDNFGKRVLSHTLSLFEVYDVGFVLIEDIKRGRQRCPTFDVVYLMSPSKKNLKRILEDYKKVDVESLLPAEAMEKDWMEKCFPCIFPTLQVPDTPTRYRDATICITSGTVREAEALVKTLARNLGTKDRFIRSMKAVTDLSVDFLPLEPELFSLDFPNALSDLYSPKREDADVTKRIKDIATRLTSALVTMNEYPYIRYKGTCTRDVTKRIAEETQAMLDEYFRIHDNLSPWGLPGAKARSSGGSTALRSERAVLIIADRSEDVVAPLTHEFTYQAMVTDIMKIEPGGTYEYTTKQAKGATTSKSHSGILDENDPIWVELRHKHVTEVVEIVQRYLKDLQNSEEAKALEGGVKADMESMSALVSELTNRDNLRVQKKIMHFTLTTELMAKFNKKNINDVGMLEQTLATGLDEAGKAPARSKTLTEVKTFLEGKLSSENKTRLLALYIIAMGGIDKSKGTMELLDAAGLNPAHYNALLNLPYLGFSVQRDEGREKRAETRSARAVAAAKSAAFELSRFVPDLEDKVFQHLHNELSMEAYPYIIPPPFAFDGPTDLSADKGKGKGKGKGKDGGSGGGGDPSADSSRAAGKSKRTNKAHAWERHSGAAEGKAGDEEEKDGGSGGTGGMPFSGGRVIVFVVGGVTYSETRAIKALSAETNRELIVGSTSVITPRAFLEQLDLINPDEGSGSDLYSDEGGEEEEEEAPRKGRGKKKDRGGDGGGGKKKGKKKGKKGKRGGAGAGLDDIDLDV